MARDVIIGKSRDGETVLAPEWALERHALIFGGSGYGKTYLSHLLALEQLKRGASLVALDPKRTTVRRLRGACQAAGLKPERVVVLDASTPQAAPGMNPFQFPGGPASSATAVYELFEKLGAFTGDRIRAFLAQAFRLAAWHGLPFLDVLRVLEEDDYRESLLDSNPLHPWSEVYYNTVRYFKTKYIAYDARERDSTLRAIETKFTELMGSELFLRMLSAKKNTVDFDHLFREPGAVLVSMETGHGLSSTGSQMLAGMVTHFLFDAARRQPGKVPVVLVVDEIRKLAGFLAEDLRDVVNMAREAGIRLIVAGQHPGQLPTGIGDDLIASSAIKAFFNPGNGGADNARFLDANDPPDPPPTKPYRSRLYARRHEDGRFIFEAVQTDLLTPLKPLPVDPDYPDAALRRFMAFAPDYVPPLVVEDGELVREVVERLYEFSARLVWRPNGAYLEISDTVERLLPAVRTNWSLTLNQLGRGQAAMVVAGRTPQVVTVQHIVPSPDASEEYVERSQRANAAPVTPTKPYVPPPKPEPPPRPAHLESSVKPPQNVPRTPPRKRANTVPAPPQKEASPPASKPMPGDRREFSDDKRSIE